MSKIIAICNQKGGVGKTTTSINLSIGLAKKNKKVLLVDFDPQGNATQGLGFDADSLEITVTTVIKKMINKDDNLKKDLKDLGITVIRNIDKDAVFEKDFGILHHEEGIDLLPANIDLAVIETELISLFFGRETILKNYFDRIREDYDYIIIDCMPSLNLITINALVAADEVIIPLHAQYYSVRGLEQLFQTIGSIRSNGLNPSLKIAGILYTCVNDRTNSFKDIHNILETAYGKNIRIFKNYIPRSVKAEEAPSYGQSIYTYDQNGKVSSAYRSFTDELILLDKGRS